MSEKKLNPLEDFFIAQAEMETPTLNKDGYNYQYADLAEIKRCTIPSLHNNGLGYKQTFEFVGEYWCLVGRVVHRSGEIVSESFYPVSVKLKAQDKGSEITYGKRYIMAAACGVVAEEDDDGKSAQKAKADEKKQGTNNVDGNKEAKKRALKNLNMTTTDLEQALRNILSEISACESFDDRQIMISTEPSSKRWNEIIKGGNIISPDGKIMSQINPLVEGISWTTS